MDTSARVRFLRMSPKKVRLVIDVIRGMDIEEAEHQLQFMEKLAALPVLKLIRSAVANAENNNKLKKENLFIKKIVADEGPTLKRWRPRAFGRAAPIRKKSTHITVVLGEQKITQAKKTTSKSGQLAKEAKIKKEERQVVDYKDIKHEAKGKEEKEKAQSEQKKKSFINLRKIKDKFTRRIGE